MKTGNTRCYPGRRWRLGVGMLLFVISAWQFGTAGYIHAKAELAQWLLADAWQKIRQGEAQTRPWPWADTWPVARLKVPRLDIDQLVLAGASGRSLAFGPGWMVSSAPPGEAGMSIIAAHRDTHFTFLQYLQPGDLLYIEREQGRSIYRVTASQVADSRHQRIQSATRGDQLVLITCYPFNAVVPGGPLRFVVFASRINPVLSQKNIPPNG